MLRGENENVPGPNEFRERERTNSIDAGGGPIFPRGSVTLRTPSACMGFRARTLPCCATGKLIVRGLALCGTLSIAPLCSDMFRNIDAVLRRLKNFNEAIESGVSQLKSSEGSESPLNRRPSAI